MTKLDERLTDLNEWKEKVFAVIGDTETAEDLDKISAQLHHKMGIVRSEILSRVSQRRIEKGLPTEYGFPGNVGKK